MIRWVWVLPLGIPHPSPSFEGRTRRESKTCRLLPSSCLTRSILASPYDRWGSWAQRGWVTYPRSHRAGCGADCGPPFCLIPEPKSAINRAKGHVPQPLDWPGAWRPHRTWLPLGFCPSFHGLEAGWSAQLVWEENCSSWGVDEGQCSQDQGQPGAQHLLSLCLTATITHSRIRAGEKMQECCVCFCGDPAEKDAWPILLNPRSVLLRHLLSVDSSFLPLKTFEAIRWKLQIQSPPKKIK